MDSILQFLSESRQSTFFPLFRMVWVVGGAALSVLWFGMAVCRDEVKAALRMADISRKEAALTMGISEGLLANKLSGEKPLTFESLGPLPQRFWQWFFLLGAQRHGLPSVIQTATAVSKRNETVGAL